MTFYVKSLIMIIDINTIENRKDDPMSLFEAKAGNTHNIKAISGNEKTKKFLMTLGCSEGEDITLISILAGNYIINVKDSRYAIDKNMAKAIELI